MRGIESI